MRILTRDRVEQVRLIRMAGLREIAEWFPVAAITAFGIALRLWSPAMRSDLWYDEVYSLTVAERPFGAMMRSLMLGGDTNPPLYTLLLHLWLKLGSSDTHVKLFSVIFGAASIWAIYLLAMLVGGRLVGLLSCLLLATSGSAITYSVEARPYAIFLLLSIISTYLFLLSIEQSGLARQPQPTLTGSRAGYEVVSVLLIYTHWFGLLVLLAQTVGLVIYSPRSKQVIQRHLLSLLLIACCCSLLLPFLWSQIRMQDAVGGFCWAGRPGWHALLDLASFLAGGKNSLGLTAALLALGYLGGRKETPDKNDRTRRHLIFLAAYLLLPVFTVYTTSHLLRHYSFFVPRYFLPFLVGLLVPVALALSRVERRIAFAFILIFACLPIFKAGKHWRAPETPYSRIASELPADSGADVLVSFLSPMSYHPVLHYRRGVVMEEKVLWSESAGRGYVLDYNLRGEMLSPAEVVDLEAALGRYKELWVVYDPLDADPKVRALWEQIRLDSRLSLEREERFEGFLLEHYKVNSL